MGMARTLIFDVDGTLVDSVRPHALCWHDAFARYGHDVPPAQIARQIGKGGDQLIQVFLSAGEIRRFGQRLLEERAKDFRQRFRHQVRPLPKVRSLFQRLKGDGYRLMLGSSGERSEIRYYMRLLRIERWVDDFTTSEDADRTKPHPDIFQATLAKAGHPKRAEVVVIGDSPYDAIAARRAGLPSIGVLCGGFSRSVLRRAGCSAVYRDPADLLKHYRFNPWPWLV